MAQNIYDSPEFFGAYARLARSVHGLDGAPEWPTVRGLLPDLRGARVVDLGCGFGAFARWAAAAGAAEVLAIDLSERMLERARADTDDERVRFETGDLDVLDLPAGAFDLAYSALALHYVADLGRLVRVVHEALRPGGRFVFTTEHPIFMAPSQPRWLDDAGTRVWPVNRYANEGLRVTDWLAPGVRKHHRTIGTTVNTLVDAGFTIDRLIEWSPTLAEVAADPTLAEERDRPMFLLVAAGR
jgi:SAM-dependent methyltransferase